MKNTKYKIFLIGAVSLIMLCSLALSNTQNNIKLSNNNEPVTIKLSSELMKCTHEDLNNYSNTIIIGTVKEASQSKWNTMDEKQPNKPPAELIPGVDVIYKDNVVSVDTYLKNPLSSKEIVVRTIGGTVGNVTMVSDDEVSLKPGEKVLLYLSNDTYPSPTALGQEHFLVFGSYQGKFTLTDDGKATAPYDSTTLNELLSTIKK